MKEKIRQLAKENFEYELPNILLSEENLQITVEAGSVYVGSFFVSNDQRKDMKGIVYSSFTHLKITNPMFIGKQNEILFLYDAKKESFGQEFSDKIHIVSNCGETSITLKVLIVEPYQTTSLGQIKDLFHFANLAHSDWEEALKLFESSDFERVFLKQEDMKTRYHGLIHGIDRNTAMEEFLIGIQKKLKINVHVDRTVCEYKKCLTNFMDKIIVEKDNWGYQSFHVSTDCDFLAIQKKNFTTKDFCGNRYHLEFLIERNKLSKGNNFGTIKLETQTETIEIQVQVNLHNEARDNNTNRKHKELILFFTQNYLNLRTEQIAYDKYMTDLAEHLKIGKDIYPYWEHKLLELHFYMMDHQSYAADALKEMEENVELMKEESLISYTAFLYLRALYTKKEEFIEEAVSFIRAYYQNGFDSWQLLWFLLYLDPSYDKHPEKKWEEIARCIDKGANSPVLYYEACLCLESDRRSRPYFQKSLPKILAFGVKMSCLSQELIDLFCFLAEQEGKSSPWIMKSLYSIYELHQSKEVLHTICKLLIYEEKKESKHFKWFAKGEEEKIKLENLYEYYIYTMEENFSLRIPANLFLFFQYDNQLSFEKKAFFYAYIIKNKHRDVGNYVVYEKLIRKFALEALKQEKIDRNLAILYEEFFQPEDVDERLAIAFCKIMFRHELTCDSNKIVGVYVSHKELLREVYTPIENGCCHIDIFTENPSVIFVDQRGNRYIDGVNHKITRFIHIHGLTQTCYEYCKSNSMLMLHMFEKIYKYQKQNENSIYVQRRCVLLPAFQSFYKGRCFESLIQYYFDHLEPEALKEMLLLADFDLLSKEFRPKAIFYCMLYDLSDKACFSMQEYGFYDIPINRMIHFCTDEIKKSSMENNNKFLLEMAFYIFNDEKYNETILTYLMHYLEGDVEVLLKLWKRCVNFDLEAYILEERILSQVLFTQEKVMKVFEVFKSYYKKGGEETIIKAYLAFTSYQYLMKEPVASDALFQFMKKESFYQESTVGTLALLSFFSKQETLSIEELEFCEKNIEKMATLGYVFQFFKNFSGKIRMPQQINHYHYVEYKCNPNNKVKIHYILEDNSNQEDYITKCMENVYFGIHVIPFLLFRDEVLSYYISEDNGSRETITESRRFEYTACSEESEEESSFEQINRILNAKDLKDEKTIITSMEHFIKCKYAKEAMLKIL